MGPKRARAAGSSRIVQSSSSSARGSDEQGVPTFVSDFAKAEFRRMGTKAVFRERGFLPSRADGNLLGQIQARGWEIFCESPTEVPVSWVKEFYANAKDTLDGFSMVLGFRVEYTERAIRRVLHLRPPAAGVEDWGLKTSEDVDLQQIVGDLCRPGTVWAPRRGSEEPSHFAASALSRYGKAWNLFICSNILPTAHGHEINVDRAILLWSIITGRYVDLGALIHRHMLAYMRGSPRGSIPYGSIVIRLCSDVGVGWSPAEPMQYPMAPLDTAAIRHLDQWQGGVADENGLGFRVLADPQQQEQAPPATDQPPEEQYVGQAQFQQFQRRLFRRVDTMQEMNSRFAQEMALTMGAAFRNPGAELHWPVYGAGVVYPPPDSPPSDEEGPSGF